MVEWRRATPETTTGLQQGSDMRLDRPSDKPVVIGSRQDEIDVTPRKAANCSAVTSCSSGTKYGVTIRMDCCARLIADKRTRTN